MNEDLKTTVCQIQDHLAPKLNYWEQMFYHYLFRHTRLEGTTTVTVGGRSLAERVGQGRKGAQSISRSAITTHLRSLESKGCIEIIDRTRDGTTIRVFVPSEIVGVLPETPDENELCDVDKMDCYSSQENRHAIFRRDQEQCCYCRKKLSVENFTIDHICPQSSGENHSHRNLLTSCFECNSRKQSQDCEEYLRENYRIELLTVEELEESRQYIRDIKDGRLEAAF